MKWTQKILISTAVLVKNLYISMQIILFKFNLIPTKDPSQRYIRHLQFKLNSNVARRREGAFELRYFNLSREFDFNYNGRVGSRLGWEWGGNYRCIN